MVEDSSRGVINRLEMKERLGMDRACHGVSEAVLAGVRCQQDGRRDRGLRSSSNKYSIAATARGWPTTAADIAVILVQSTDRVAFRQPQGLGDLELRCSQ